MSAQPPAHMYFTTLNFSRPSLPHEYFNRSDRGKKNTMLFKQSVTLSE